MANAAFEEVNNPLRVQIVSDTILVVQDTPSEADPYWFKAYSLKTLKYLGPFIQKGRGPGEMSMPYLGRNCPNENYLRIINHDVGQVHFLDVVKSIASSVMSKKVILPIGAFDYIPLTDSTVFVPQLETTEYLFRVEDSDGNNIIKTFSPYRRLDGERTLTHMSDMWLFNNKTGRLAEIMLFFPQINLVDTDSDRMRSIAVDQRYRLWRTIMNSPISPDMIQYYSESATSEEYIFAVYDNAPLSKIITGDYTSLIHVFNWDGDLIWKLIVKERITAIAYDDKEKYLYCIEKAEGKILRYDVGELFVNKFDL